MQNLAGDRTCDENVYFELGLAGVEIITHSRPPYREVSTIYTGRLGPFEFVRAATYYSVTGYVPLEVAKEIFEDRCCRTGTRVNGDAEHKSPEECALPKEEDFVKIPGTEGLNNYQLLEMRKNGQIDGPLFIRTYHIDTGRAMLHFVKILKAHNLV